MTGTLLSVPNISYLALWQRIFPVDWMRELIHQYELDLWMKKLLFRPFISFLVMCCLLETGRLASRDLAMYSRQVNYQQTIGIPAVAHSSITVRLNQIPPPAMNELLARAHAYARSKNHKKGRLLPQIKVFDTTTWTVSPDQFPWAANMGDKGAIRFILVMNGRTGLPERLLDACRSTSDNDTFEEVIRQTRAGTIWIFDRGFNRLRTLKEILDRHCSFITRWSESYSWIEVSQRKIDSFEKLSDGWLLVRDAIGWVGRDRNPGRAQYRRITCFHPETKKTFEILTNRRNERAAKLVQMYLLRWSIEVTFRHIKSCLGVVHFPVHSLAGVHNWLVIVALSVMFVDLLAVPAKSQPLTNLVRPHYPFRTYWRSANVQLENEWANHLWCLAHYFVELMSYLPSIFSVNYLLLVLGIY